MDRWREKVAVVTGSSAGIGLTIVKALLREGMFIVGLDTKENEEAMKNVVNCDKFVFLKCDVKNELDVIRAFDYVKNNLKTVHILINNAGIVSAKTIEEATGEELQEIMNVNVMGVLHCYRQAIKLMKENGEEGYIINMNSVSGYKIPNVLQGNGKHVSLNVYAPSKFAITGLSEVIIRELQGHKIRVTNLSPAYVKTDIVTEEEFKKHDVLFDVPALKTDDIANSIIYLISLPLRVQVTEMRIESLGSTW